MVIFRSLWSSLLHIITDRHVC